MKISRNGLDDYMIAFVFQLREPLLILEVFCSRQLGDWHHQPYSLKYKRQILHFSVGTKSFLINYFLRNHTQLVQYVHRI